MANRDDGITLDLNRARERLLRAIEIAASEQLLPEEWERRSVLIGAAKALTYTPMLGTGLLARATNDHVDALALKKTSGPTAYSARTLSHRVLVPAAVTYGFDIRNTGREPLNNQPFFRYDRVDAVERVRFPNDHRYLVESLRRANGMSQDEALLALAAFVRVCFRRARSRERASLGDVAIGVRATVAAAKALLAEGAEGGKRAQALAAAAFDIVYGADRVHSLRINDPSRHFPGDVQIVDSSGHPVISAEVRDKPITLTEIEQFAAALASAQITRGMIVAVALTQPDLDYVETVSRIAEERGVLLLVLDGVDDLLLSAFGWSPRSLTDALALFPERVDERLHGIEVAQATTQRWAELIRPVQEERVSLQSSRLRT